MYTIIGDGERGLAHALKDQEEHEPANRLEATLNRKASRHPAYQAQDAPVKPSETEEVIARPAEGPQGIQRQEEAGKGLSGDGSKRGSPHAERLLC